MKLTSEQRVQKAHIWLMNEPKYCLYSGVLMMGQTSVVDDAPTAYTDGFNTKYGRKFVDKLKDEELRGLILHENLHKAFRHLTTWEDLWKKNPKLANMACDYVINLMIVDSDPSGTHVQLPEGGLLDEQFRGMDAGTVFRILEQQPKRKGRGKGEGSKGEDSQQGDEDGEGDGSESDAEEASGGFDEHGWEQAREMSPKEKERITRDIDQALRQGALLAGKMKGAVPQQITDLLASKIDWREALREFITSICVDKDVSTWRRPNRRWVDRDVYLPSVVGESVGRIVIAADMSGSMHSVLGKVFSEIVHICNTVKPEGIDLLYWDAEVCAVEKYDLQDLDSLMTTTQPSGGGGTNPQCVPDYIKEHRLKPECVIMLTDGIFDSWGTGWSVPVLWGVTTDRVSDNGVTIKIGEE